MRFFQCGIITLPQSTQASAKHYIAKRFYSYRFFFYYVPQSTCAYYKTSLIARYCNSQISTLILQDNDTNIVNNYYGDEYNEHTSQDFDNSCDMGDGGGGDFGGGDFDGGDFGGE